MLNSERVSLTCLGSIQNQEASSSRVKGFRSVVIQIDLALALLTLFVESIDGILLSSEKILGRFMSHSHSFSESEP